MEGSVGGVDEGDGALNRRGGYGLAALAVFAIEVVIALFVDDAVVRPYVGDVLAVVLVYLAVRWVTPLGPLASVAAALALALIIELGQYVHVLSALGLEHNRLARTVLGGVFDPKDLIAYAAGTALVLIIERFRGVSLTPPPAARW